MLFNIKRTKLRNFIVFYFDITVSEHRAAEAVKRAYAADMCPLPAEWGASKS